MSPIPLGILDFPTAAAGAYDLLETQVLSSSASSVTFTGLGSYTDYKHLQIRTTINHSTGSGFSLVRFNSDSGSNYARHELYGDGTNVVSGYNTSSTFMSGPYRSTGTNLFGAGVLDILDFNSSTKNKTIRLLTGRQDSFPNVALLSGFWNNTNALSSVELFVTSGSFTTGSRFSLYGVK